MKNAKMVRRFVFALAAALIAAVFPAAAFAEESGAPVTRAEFASMLIDAISPEMGEEWMVQQFADIPEDAPYYDNLLKAKAIGLIAGIGDNCFAPEAPVTKEQMYVMLYNAMKIANKLPPFETMQWVIFSDWDDVANYAGNNIQTLAKLGLVMTEGTEGNLYPKGTVTREEAEKLIISAFETTK